MNEALYERGLAAQGEQANYPQLVARPATPPVERAPAPLRVLVADDHACVRLGVTQLLRATPGATVVGEADDTLALATQLDMTPCDVVISDLCMPGLHGEYSSLAVLRRLAQASGAPAVVVLTMMSTPQILTGLLQIGLTVIVDKRDVTVALLSALAAACAGQAFLSEHVRAALDNAGADCAPCAGIPSAREWEVFQLYAQGMPVCEIANRLQRSVKTISSQKRSTMRKLGLVTERDLIDFATLVGIT
ncbi:response regulator transcription factor [Paraburkholderia acidisoli]|uniref:Response regulator n=1 Tax=Paraburkholderia acidisoli TaxID=2571748 RepID=A0A7Z2JDF5_9BURK|nr:response regulator transcription factor [Paraburkholderia acidisoli]QGZ60531.1 response regulator [Paraburkholderia acidisoli]